MEMECKFNFPEISVIQYSLGYEGTEKEEKEEEICVFVQKSSCGH